MKYKKNSLRLGKLSYHVATWIGVAKMTLKILYVENDDRDFQELHRSIGEFNKNYSPEKLDIKRSYDPEQMRDMLDPQYDVVLADVYFNDPKTKQRDKIPRLKDIIDFMIKWSKENNNGRIIPIIAYSGVATLTECLKNKHFLYDIWDKNTTSVEYVTWRLSKLAIDVSRINNDACLQKLIREMQKGASWHEYVKEMTIDYDSAWTEFDQIERAGRSIKKISNIFNTFEVCSKMWNVMEKSDAIARAFSRKVRGHSRHAINVFWLGYCLIHSSLLQNLFVNFYDLLLQNRQDMMKVSKDEPIEALSNIWFYAGLFHDIGISIEKSKEQYEYQKMMIDMFGEYALALPELVNKKSNNLNDNIMKIMYTVEEGLRKLMIEYFLKSIKDNKPDHGLVAANYLLNNIIKDKRQQLFAAEASRAILFHSIACSLDIGDQFLFSWEREPITCLLLLCDQLQTWDREREDKKLSDDDKPERAELLDLRITEDKKKNTITKKISIYIDYIVEPHVLRYPDIYQRVKNNLETVILEKPNVSLKRIATPWPFSANVIFSLGRNKFLEIPFS